MNTFSFLPLEKTFLWCGVGRAPRANGRLCLSVCLAERHIRLFIYMRFYGSFLSCALESSRRNVLPPSPLICSSQNHVEKFSRSRTCFGASTPTHTRSYTPSFTSATLGQERASAAWRANIVILLADAHLCLTVACVFFRKSIPVPIHPCDNKHMWASRRVRLYTLERERHINRHLCKRLRMRVFIMFDAYGKV